MGQLFIDGAWTSAQEGGSREIRSPADGSLVAVVDEATAVDTEAAIGAARRAFDDGRWSGVAAPERGALLGRVADLLQRDRDRLARAETADTGKRVVESEIDIDDITNCFRWFSHLAGTDDGRLVETGIPTARSKVVHDPVGVCGLITPWNYPLLQTAWKVAPALGAGCTFVLKPSELTPHTAIILMELLTEAGLPGGVANLVLGAGATAGAPLSTDPRVDMVSFTGGLVTGKRIMASASDTVKKVALELGGKNPFVLFADADHETAVDNVLTAIFLHSGQVCSAGARLVVEESAHDRVVDDLVARAQRIRLGGPDDPDTETGPLISAAHRDKVEAYVAAGVAEGAVLRCGGERPSDPKLQDGFFYPPTILDGCTQDMTVVHEESFGPVLTVETFTDLDDAVRIANDTEYGLAGAVFSADHGTCEEVAARLRHGTVWINDFGPYVPAAEWGGFGHSGVGRELGRAGFSEYQEPKHIWTNIRPGADRVVPVLDQPVHPGEWFVSGSEKARPETTTDSADIDEFGYKPSLVRSLGSFHTFAAGISYISILTGTFQLFYFGLGSGGPAYWWSWPLVFLGQLMVALCFCELAARFPVAGSIYNWTKRLTSPHTAWLAGWTMLTASIVSIAAVALALQATLPELWDGFQFIPMAGDEDTAAQALNGVILASILIVFTTAINAFGTKLMAQINAAGVFIELVAAVLLIILLAINIVRGPQIVFDTGGIDTSGRPLGYAGAFLVAMFASLYVMYGFDTASSLAEESHEPRKNAPKAILRALFFSFLLGGLILLFALMSAPDLADPAFSSLGGLQALILAVLGPIGGSVILVAVVIAVIVCALAVHAAAIRLAFAMSRDNNLPAGTKLCTISPRFGTPIVSSVAIGVIAIVLLFVTFSPQIYTVVTSIAIIMIYTAYLLVTVPLLIKRLRGQWEPREGAFSLGRWGLPVNIVAVLWGGFMAINLAWPRNEVYNASEPFHWYLQWGGVLLPGIILGGGFAYYWAVQRHKTGVVAEHARVDAGAPTENRPMEV